MFYLYLCYIIEKLLFMEFQNITISDINTGLKGYIQYSHQHNNDESIKKFSLNERVAIITHYLHNQGTAFAKPFRRMALKLMNDVYEWKMNNICYDK